MLAGAIREKVFGISVQETSVKRRGFHSSGGAAKARAEQIGQTFVDGYHSALREGTAKQLVDKLNQTPIELRGFAFEGAAMGLTLLDYLTPWKRDRFKLFLDGPGNAHKYMLHVGAGWAMARLPWSLNAKLERLDPLLRWLAIDGYGFHDGYFRWKVSVDQQKTPSGVTGYARRAYQQGLGRSLWFVKGSDIGLIAKAVNNFPEESHDDLWSGVGLAAAYAGGVTEDELRRLVELAGSQRPMLAQGVAFAAKARQRAGNQAPHTSGACEVICRQSTDEAANVTDKALEGLTETDRLPAYEVWRQRIHEHYQQSIR